MLPLILLVTVSAARGQSAWSELDSRPLPDWYDRAKVGILVHWGLYSLLGNDSQYFIDPKKTFKDIESFMVDHFTPGFSYEQFAAMFTAEGFAPDDLAELFRCAGAKYVVFTSKHLDGYRLFPSNPSPVWNSVYLWPKRDLVGELANSVRAKGLKFGVYYSLSEWNDPLYTADKWKKFRTRYFVDMKIWPDIKQLIKDYKPSVLWVDGDGLAGDGYWDAAGLLAQLYRERDELVVNDRWGAGTGCTHGDVFTCQQHVGSLSTRNCSLANHKWENVFSIDPVSWSYRPGAGAEDVCSAQVVIRQVVTTVSCGGNVLINIGLTKEGRVPALFKERLLTLGSWLQVNGEAIYSTSPWLYQQDGATPDVWYTCVKTSSNTPMTARGPSPYENILSIYAIFLTWPSDNYLKLAAVVPYLCGGNYEVEMLDHHRKSLKWMIMLANGVVAIELPKRMTEDDTEYGGSIRIYRTGDSPSGFRHRENKMFSYFTLKSECLVLNNTKLRSSAKAVSPRLLIQVMTLSYIHIVTIK